MSDRTVHIPLDVESRTQFRILEGRIGKEKALAALFILFRELGYAAQCGSVEEGIQLGTFEGARLDLFRAAIAPVCGVDDLATDGGLLVLVKSEDRNPKSEINPKAEIRYHCSLFAAENGHLDPGFVPIQKMGGIARAVKYKEKQSAAEAVKQAEMINGQRAGELFSKEIEGGSEAMTQEEKNKVLMLVRLVDSVLGRKSRLTSEYTPGLTTDAYTVVTKFSKEQINAVCQHLMKQRDREGRTVRTEEVLRQFEAYVGRVEMQ